MNFAKQQRRKQRIVTKLSSGQIGIQKHMKWLFFNPWPGYHVPIFVSHVLLFV